MALHVKSHSTDRPPPLFFSIMVKDGIFFVGGARP
jgi:hypothetical protein